MIIDVGDEPRRYHRAVDFPAQRVPVVWCRLASRVFCGCGAEEKLTPAPRRVLAPPTEHRGQVIPPVRSRGPDVDSHNFYPRASPAATKVTTGGLTARPALMAEHNRGMADLVTRLLPILHVPDPDAKCRFYQQLGLRTTYEGQEYLGFIAVGNDAVEFGLSRRPGADPAAPGFTWQLGVRDIDATIPACQQAGLSFEVTEERPRPDWAYRVVKVRSPNGMEVLAVNDLDRFTAGSSIHHAGGRPGRMGT
jgi:catechol 2,3-dioxygenase-like lactoylglutathione lyase family enzyme